MKAIPSIKRSDCKFYVNEEKRTVVCVIPGTENLFLHFVASNFEFTDMEFCFYGNLLHSFWMPQSFMGKAVCSGEDEWDEETGRLIAYTRARDKLYKSFYRRANAYVDLINDHIFDVIETFNELGSRVSKWQETLEEEVEKKTKGED